MLRFFFGLFILTSCSMGVKKTGGEKAYVYDVNQEYDLEKLKSISREIVITSTRDPQVGTHKDIFSTRLGPIKKVGIVVFESLIQPTRGGLAEENRVYLSAQGKQLLTERLLAVWDQGFPVINQQIEYVSSSGIKASKVLRNYGSDVEEFIFSKRSALAPDDIFFLAKGKETTSVSLVNPRGMRDLSLLLVPASELMEGPKFSEHQKHFVNEISRELGLDAVIVIMNELSWSAARVDKHSGESIPEELKVKLSSSVLIPYSDYHRRLKALGNKTDRPYINVAFGTYEAMLKVPVHLSVAENQQNFSTIERELLNPMIKTYSDLAQMIMIRIGDDMTLTHQ